MKNQLNDLLKQLDDYEKKDLYDYCINLIHEEYFEKLIDDYRLGLIQQCSYNISEIKRSEYYYQLKGFEGFINHINNIIEFNKRQQ